MTQQHTVGKSNTAICNDGEFTEVIYYSTKVVRFNSNIIILNTGGHFTSSTKSRMNQTSSQFNLGYSVFSKKGEWAVTFCGQDFPFVGNTVLLTR